MFGTFSIAVALPELGKLILCSNHGSLYYGKKNNVYIYSSRKISPASFKLYGLIVRQRFLIFLNI